MYKVIETIIRDSMVYGIEGGGERVLDLSTDFAGARELAFRCNDGDLASWQLWDVAEDWTQAEGMGAWN